VDTFNFEVLCVACEKGFLKCIECGEIYVEFLNIFPLLSTLKLNNF